MIASWLYKISNRLRCRVIKLDDQPYLERYYVGKLLGITFYLHRFVGGDGDRALHDHPWDAAALVLCGGYYEEQLVYLCPNGGTVVTTRRVNAGRLNRIRINKFHRIYNPTPNTWTLFMHDRRIKGWGFLERFRTNRIVYHQPLDVSSVVNWHLHAPTGAALRAEGVIQ